MSEHPPLSIHFVAQIARELRMVVCGELVFETAREFEAALVAELSERGRVLLDFSELTFMDSSGIRVLVSAMKLAQRCGWELGIRDEMPEHVRSVLRTTGVEPFLPLVAE